MNKYQRVEGHSNLVRDKSTGAILNTNTTEIARAKKLKEARLQETKKLESLSDRVDSLQNDMNQIKDLLFRLIEDKK